MAELESSMTSAVSDLKKVNEEKIKLTEYIADLEERNFMISS